MDYNISLAAVAYYNNCSNPELKQLALEFFQSIDTNRDGRVSFDEFIQFLHRSGYNWVMHPSFFSQLDVNRDGSLDFSEFLAFYYILKTRNVWCAGCRVNLLGLYFTCVECFDAGGTPFDVCAPCYITANSFCHHHGRDQFLDSFVLLRSKRGVSHVENFDMALTPPPPPPPPSQNHSILNACFIALELALSAGNFIGCNIM